MVAFYITSKQANSTCLLCLSKLILPHLLVIYISIKLIQLTCYISFK